MKTTFRQSFTRDLKKIQDRALLDKIKQVIERAEAAIQRAPAEKSKSERYAFAAGKKTYGQKCRAIGREVLRSLLELSKRYFAEGKSCDEVLEVLMPA